MLKMIQDTKTKTCNIASLSLKDENLNQFDAAWISAKQNISQTHRYPHTLWCTALYNSLEMWCYIDNNSAIVFPRKSLLILNTTALRYNIILFCAEAHVCYNNKQLLEFWKTSPRGWQTCNLESQTVKETLKPISSKCLKSWIRLIYI